MKKLLTLTLFLASSYFVLESCGTAKEVTETKEKEPECKKNVNYASIEPIITANCISCHGQKSAETIGDFTTFNGLKKYLENGKFEKLVLIKKTMPAGGALSKEDYNLILCWKNNNFKEH